jgi:hypothetical protein
VIPLRLLGGSTTTTAAHRTTATAGLEVTAGTLATHAATATRSTAARESTSPVELARVLTAFLDLDLDTVDRVGVSSDSSLESSGSLEIDESAVLRYVSWNVVWLDAFAYFAAADVKVLDLTVLGKGSLQSSVVNLAVDVLDVGALLVGVGSGSCILCTRLLLLVSSSCLPASGLTLASRWGLVTGGCCSLARGGGSSSGLRGSGGSGLGILRGLLGGGGVNDGSSDLVCGGCEAGPGSGSGRLRRTRGHGDRSGLLCRLCGR